MRAIPVFLGILMVSVSLANAVPTPPETGIQVGQAAADPAQAQALAGILTHAAGSGSAVTALQAMLAANGIVAAPLRVQPEAVDAPGDLAVPLGRLLAAAHVAEQLRIEALAQLTPEQQRQALDGMWSAPLVQGPIALPEGEARIGTLSSLGVAPAPGMEQLASQVDTAKLATAALTILQAIEESAPALRLAGPLPHTDAAPCPGVTGTHYAVQSCATLIVGDTGVNGYSAAAQPIVLVDLGGNDAYTNNAAAAALGVRIVVDVAGNDAYTQGASGSLTPVAITAMGTGVLGVGVLADLAGNDLYDASASTTSPQPGPVGGDATVSAQGFGALGAGVLADFAGVDRFTMRATSDGGPATTQGQGGAALGGVGALLNLGNEAGSDDTYTATATSTLHLISSTTSQQVYSIGPGSVAAQGGSIFGGVGALADAGGNDAYTAAALGGVASTAAQGGAGTGAGALVDAQGDDKMTASAIGDTTLSLVSTDQGFCFTDTVTVTVGDTQAYAQGGAATGAGALIDGTGNDARTLTASSRAGAIAEARGNTACPNVAIATATSGRGVALGQGAVLIGGSVLVDGTGNDVNTITGSSTAYARAISSTPANAGAEQPTATAGAATGQGQGMASIGAGLSLDATGNDKYAMSLSSLATRVKTSGTTTTAGPLTQQAQGFGGAAGIGWLVDGDGTDTYSATLGTAAGNNACWSNGGSQGRGRDWSLLSVLPFVCN